MPAATTIFQALGGPDDLAVTEVTLDALRERIRAGLPFSALESLMSLFHLGREEISRAADLPQRTLTRRKRERQLSPEESDRLYRVARIAAQAAEVLGDREKASLWLQRPNRALGGDPPLTFLDTDVGTRQVEEVLGRIEHGVYS